MSTPTLTELLDTLRNLKIEHLSPIECMTRLYEFRRSTIEAQSELDEMQADLASVTAERDDADKRAIDYSMNLESLATKIIMRYGPDWEDDDPPLASAPSAAPASAPVASDSADDEIAVELAAQDLRRAQSHESGWYALTSFGKVWATDLPLPDEKPASAAPDASAAAARLTKAQQDALSVLGKVEKAYIGNKSYLYKDVIGGQLGCVNSSAVKALISRGLAQRKGVMYAVITDAGKVVLS